MKKMLKLASLSGVALAVLSTVALAADLPSRKAPIPYIAPPPVFTWTGFYIGLNAGAAFRNNNNNNNSYYGYGYGNNSNNNKVAFIGGGQIGYNFQTGPVVFGLEADAQYRSSFGNSNNGGYYGYGYGSNNNNGNFFGTARGRLGYTITPALLAYATGGLAYGTVSNNVGGLGYGYGYGNNSNNNFRVGYTVGGGLEYSFTPNWSIKAEYLFVDLGRGNNNNTYFGYNTSSQRAQFHVARMGVNYRFNFGGVAPVVARY